MRRAAAELGDSISTTIHARPPEPEHPIWIHVTQPDVSRWCVVRSADHQTAVISTLCCAELPHQPVTITTRRPHNTCPACEIELAAGTPGAARAVTVKREPDEFLEVDTNTGAP